LKGLLLKRKKKTSLGGYGNNRMWDENARYVMPTMDELMLELTRLGDGDFVEEIFERYDVFAYDPLPKEISNVVTIILRARLRARKPDKPMREENEETT